VGAGRPAIQNPMRRVLHTPVTDEQHDMVKEQADLRGLTKAAMVRSIIYEWFERRNHITASGLRL
jgi:hypothetical protein